MRQSSRLRFTLWNTLACGVVLALAALPVAAGAELTETFSTDRLTVRNLIGEVRIEPGGSAFEVRVQVQGAGAKDGMITLDATDDRLDIVFPEGHSDYVYPRLGRNEDVDLKMRDSNWLGSLLGTDRIEVSGSGRGLELWADVTILVPSGSELEVKNGVGQVIAKNVAGELELATRSGGISAEGTDGTLQIATGSGEIEVARSRGEEIQIATGSGNVTVEDVDGEEIQVATGSGDINVSMIRGRSAQFATGSGDIEARAISSDEADAATGSGDVTLILEQMGRGEYNVGTGSGDIVLGIPHGAGAEIHAETDRGRIDVELDDPTDFRRRESDEVRVDVNGGGAEISLGSGTGDIRIRNQ